MNDHFETEAAQWDSNPERIQRAKIISDEIKKNISLSTGYSGLDFGCGTGLLGLNFVNDAAHFTFVDTSEAMIEQIRRKISANSLPADAYVKDLLKEDPGQKYDLIISLLALHHIEDHKEILKRLVSFMTKNSYICIADLEEEDGTFHRGMDVPHHGFKISEIENILESFGLEKISSSTPYHNKRELSGKTRKFPLFLVIYKKNY